MHTCWFWRVQVVAWEVQWIPVAGIASAASALLGIPGGAPGAATSSMVRVMCVMRVVFGPCTPAWERCSLTLASRLRHDGLFVFQGRGPPPRTAALALPGLIPCALH